MKHTNRIQQIHRYIRNSRMPLELSNRYDLDPRDLIAIVASVKGNAYAAALLAFTYGKAKGYRAGGSEAKRHG